MNGSKESYVISQLTLAESKKFMVIINYLLVKGPTKRFASSCTKTFDANITPTSTVSSVSSSCLVFGGFIVEVEGAMVIISPEIPKEPVEAMKIEVTARNGLGAEISRVVNITGIS